MASIVIKNWDNKTWLSSHEYIKTFNKFLLKNIKLNSNSKILDIGCGRGNILGNLNSILKLKNKPLGIDIVNHKDKDKRINFKKINASKFFSKNKEKFDLILIKQTIHLLNFNEIKRLLKLSKENLSHNGKVFIFTLDVRKNEIPTFKLMKSRLMTSLKRDRKIIRMVTKLYPYRLKKRFIFRVKIIKSNYLNMIKNKYISTLLSLSNYEISKGLDEINLKYRKNICFKDKLICMIL
tara:strand:- start:1635 stop:2345 length:711 start_codon:yes stop_codon:yes gene_type:complete